MRAGSYAFPGIASHKWGICQITVYYTLQLCIVCAIRVLVLLCTSLNYHPVPSYNLHYKYYVVFPFFIYSNYFDIVVMGIDSCFVVGLFGDPGWLTRHIEQC